MGRRPNQALRSVWKQRIARQRRSGLSVAKFCRQEGCSQQAFYAWCRRLRDLVERTMIAFESVFFGHHPLDQRRFEACWSQVAEFQRLLDQESEQQR